MLFARLAAEKKSGHCGRRDLGFLHVVIDRTKIAWNTRLWLGSFSTDVPAEGHFGAVVLLLFGSGTHIKSY